MAKRILIAALLGGAAAAVATMVTMALGLGATAEKIVPAICVGLAAAFAVRRKARPAGSPAGPSPASQAVGFSCAACGKRIAFAVEATRCPRCDAPLHSSCSAQHSCPTSPSLA
jgi:hypothetical protein